MVSKKFAVLLSTVFVLAACCACEVNSDSGSGTGTGTGTGSGNQTAHTQFKAADYANLPVLPFTSVQAVQESGSSKFKMQASWADTYHVTFSSKNLARLEVYDESGTELKCATASFDLKLNEGQTVYVNAAPVKDKVRFTVKGEDNPAPLPLELGEAPDITQFDTTGNPAVDPLEPATISYVKRKNTKYVYSNAPETLLPEHDIINKCVTRQDVSDQSVYFTFEHQSRELQIRLGRSVYYGYRVRNTGEQDMYVTVRSVGFQFAGKGAYMGEEEWINFYRTKFALPDFSDVSESAMGNYTAHLDFYGKYIVNEYQPTTYRIPAGQYMYVMGGTTVDAFDGINVADTANKKSINAVVENGAVVFDVVGKAEGAFYIYDDISAVKPGTPGGDSHMGGTIQPDASCGWDEGYVVDNQATWTFNDNTQAQTLPVTFTNYYNEDMGSYAREYSPYTGKPNTPIEGTTAHVQNRTDWATHLDVQQAHDAVGTDVALFHTVDLEGNEVVYGCNYWDSEGKLPNMGSWMKDYQDVFTFVNQGNQPRTVRINIVPNGAMPVMMRSMDGKRVMEEGLKPFYAMYYNANEYGDRFDKACHYEVVIPAHSVKQFVVEYNLMANSYGYVKHSVDLI